MDRFGEAIVILKKQVDLFPENPLLHNNISWCYSSGPGVLNPEKALRHAREALLFAPYEAFVWNTLAEAYYVSGDYEKALRSSEHAVDLLSGTNLSDEKIQSYTDQSVKILRALDAMKMLEGLSEER